MLSKNLGGIKSFDRTKKKKIIGIGVLIGILLIIVGIRLYKTFALYEEKNEFNVLKGVIPDFSEKDIYTSVNMGDYISYSPTKTYYEIPEELTGCTSGSNPSDFMSESDCNRLQTINPSELNLWRVIRKNEDGTIEIVSEYVSNNSIYIRKAIGYRNLIKTLNEIAKSYETEEITVASRHIGYNGQIAEISSDSEIFSNVYALWSESTTNTNSPIGSEREQLGGGDIGYESDTNLVEEAIGTLIAYNVNSKKAQAYFLASRYYHYVESTRWYGFARCVNASGILDSFNNLYYHYNGFSGRSVGYSIRPIVILKSGLKAKVENIDNKKIYKVN